MRIDLHLHSTASDGTLAPAALVRAAAAAGLDLIALTDHDTASGIAEARTVPAPPIVIPGIEVSSTHGGAELHFLGYFIDPAHPALERFAHQAIARRRDRMEGMVRRLQALGVAIGIDEVIAEAGAEATALGRPHLARVLVQRGYVQSFAEAFERYLADGGPAFLPTELLTPREAIDLIHDLGGIAVWAHPPADAVEPDLPHLVRWGLDGVECYRPRHTEADTRRLLDAARAHRLVITGGSDWHGGWHGRLGAFAVVDHQVEAFLRLGGI